MTEIIKATHTALAKKPGIKKGQIRKNSPRELAAAFTSRMVADFKKHGIKTIERVREESPAEYLKLITRILPKDVNFNVQHTFSDVLMEAHRMIENRKRMNGHDVLDVEATVVEESTH